MADSLHSQLGVSVAKLAPPAVVTAYAIAAKGLPVIVGFATLTYLILQIGHLIWSWRQQIERRRAELEDRE